jgi:hypothetical protein
LILRLKENTNPCTSFDYRIKRGWGNENLKSWMWESRRDTTKKYLVNFEEEHEINIKKIIEVPQTLLLVPKLWFNLQRL